MPSSFPTGAPQQASGGRRGSSAVIPSLKGWPSRDLPRKMPGTKVCHQNKAGAKCTGGQGAPMQCGLGSKYRCLGVGKSMASPAGAELRAFQRTLNVAQDQSKAVQLHAELEKLPLCNKRIPGKRDNPHRRVKDREPNKEKEGSGSSTPALTNSPIDQ